jgi:ABC-2 type transport system ATP-binding protein
LVLVGSDEPHIDPSTNRVTVPVADGWAAVTAVARAIGSLDVQVDDIGLRRPTLDEVFLTLTGTAARTERQNSVHAARQAEIA